MGNQPGIGLPRASVIGVPVSSRLLVSAITPLKAADQAARLVWLMDNWPRVALSLRAVVNRSRRCQSLVGWVSKASENQTPFEKRAVWPKLVITTPLPVQVCQVARSMPYGFQ